MIMPDKRSKLESTTLDITEIEPDFTDAIDLITSKTCHVNRKPD